MIPDLSVAANIFYGHEPRVVAGRVSVRRLRRAGREVLDRYGFPDIDPSAHVRDLRLAERQLVEVVKTLIRKPRVADPGRANLSSPTRVGPLAI